MSEILSVSPSVEAALCHFRVSTGIRVDPHAFGEALRLGQPLHGTELALEMHLREADPAELASLILDGVTSFESLKRLADQFLPVNHSSHAFIARFVT